MNHEPRHSRLDGVDGATLRTMFEGAMRNYHAQLFDLRSAFAALDLQDPERNPGLAVTMLADEAFHTLEHRINLFASIAQAFAQESPLILIQEGDGSIAGLDVLPSDR